MRRKLEKIAATGVLVLIMTGCATNSVSPVPNVSCPPVPSPPEVVVEELECLSDNTYNSIIERDRQLQDWGLELHAICTTIEDRQQ